MSGCGASEHEETQTQTRRLCPISEIAEMADEDAVENRKERELIVVSGS